MNILCVDQYSNLGGAQRTLLELLPSFSERGWQLQAALSGDGPLAGAIRALGHEAYNIQIGSYTKVKKGPAEMLRYAREWPRVTRSLLRIARSKSIELIYANGPRILPAAAWVSNHLAIPLVFHCHNRLHQGAAIELAGRSLQFVRARVIACCHYAADPLRSYVEPGRLRVLYNGVAAPEIALRQRHGAPRIGVIGRIEKEKGQLEFIAAARILLRQFPDIDCSVIGSPLFSDGTYLQTVRGASADLPVVYEGWKADMAQVFASLDVLVVPSSPLDATPRVIVEALAAGVPVVAFAVGGIPEIIRDGETGFLVKEGTPAALADGIASVLRMDQRQVAGLRTRGQQAWRKDYSLEQFHCEVCNIVQQAARAA